VSQGGVPCHRNAARRRRSRRKARKGFRGYPVATIAYYGPDADHASKVAVGLILAEGEEAAEMGRWWSSDGADARSTEAILGFVRTRAARTVVVTDRILGCPHEEVVDHPAGGVCPECPYWATPDRWSGEIVD
jgi:hypothetical protein